MVSVDPVPSAPGLFDLYRGRGAFDDWPRYLENVRTELRAIESVRFVVVVKFDDLWPASLPFLGDGKRFDPGHATFRAVVGSFPNAEIVCSGTGTGRMGEEIVYVGKVRSDFEAMAARDAMQRQLHDVWTEATVASPLQDVCSAGGNELCERTNLYTKYVHLW